MNWTPHRGGTQRGQRGGAWGTREAGGCIVQDARKSCEDPAGLGQGEAPPAPPWREATALSWGRGNTSKI